MKDLIQIKVENDQQLVSARDLHKGLGLKRKFTERQHRLWNQKSKLLL